MQTSQKKALKSLNLHGKPESKLEDLHEDLAKKKDEISDLIKETDSMQKDLDSTHQEFMQLKSKYREYTKKIRFKQAKGASTSRPLGKSSSQAALPFHHTPLSTTAPKST